MIVLKLIIVIGSGIIRAISMSNTRKITASRKNRREKGIRADLLGSNPHSNGDIFSRSLDERLARIQEMRNTIGGRRIPIMEKDRASSMKALVGNTLLRLQLKVVIQL